MAVSLVVVAALSAVALPLYSSHERAAHDLAAESDVRNAMYVVQVCTAVDGNPPASALTVVGGTPAPACDGQVFTVSEGTVLTYRPEVDGLSFVVRAHNTGGRPAYWCWDATVGGSIRAVAGPADTC